MNKKKDTKKEEKAAQEAAAKALQQQIDDIVSGSVPSGLPRNFRDFIDQKTKQGQKRRDQLPSSSRNPKKA